jgi:hypothetical protein
MDLFRFPIYGYICFGYAAGWMVQVLNILTPLGDPLKRHLSPLVCGNVNRDLWRMRAKRRDYVNNHYFSVTIPALAGRRDAVYRHRYIDATWNIDMRNCFWKIGRRERKSSFLESDKRYVTWASGEGRSAVRAHLLHSFIVSWPTL